MSVCSVWLCRLLVCVCVSLVAAPPGWAAGSVRAAQRRVKRLRNLRKIANRDSFGRRVMRNTIRERGRRLTRTQLRWVPLGAKRELRKITIATILRKMAEETQLIKGYLKDNPGKAVWDVAVVGAGNSAADIATALSTGENPQSVVVLEGSDKVSKTLRELGDTVARNSANRPDVAATEPLRRGFGNKNPSEGPWSEPEFSGEEYPGVGGFAETATANLYASGADVLLNTTVERKQTRGQQNAWPARYRLTTADGMEVYAQQVVFATGAPKTKIRGFDEASEQLIREVSGQLNLEQPENVPQIVSAIGALRAANLARHGRDPFRRKPDTAKQERVISTGEQIRTNVPSRLKGRPVEADGTFLDTELDKVRGFAFNNGRWEVTLEDGTELQQSTLEVQLGVTLLSLTQSDTPRTLADRLNQAEVRDMSGSPMTLEMNMVEQSGRTTTRTGKASNAERRVALLQRLRATYGIGTNDGINAKQTDGQSTVIPLNQITDVVATPEGKLEVESQGNRRTFDSLELSNVTLTAQDPRFRPDGEPIDGNAVLRRQVEDVSAASRPGFVPSELIGQTATGSRVNIPWSSLRRAAFRQDVNLLRLETESGVVELASQGILLRASTDNGPEEIAFQGRVLAEFGVPDIAQRPIIAVVGGKDTGRSFLQYLYGQAPEPAYNGPGKADYAQRGEVGDVVWIVGDNGPADCPQFLQTTRSRYLQLAGKVREVAGGDPPRAELVKARATSVRRIESGANRGRLELTVGGQTRIVDKLVLASGIETSINEFYDAEPTLEPVRGTLPGLSGERVIAKRERGEDVFFVGPAAGDGVIAEDEQFNTKENSAARYGFVKRNIELARSVIAKGPRVQSSFPSEAATSIPKTLVGLRTGQTSTTSFSSTYNRLRARRLEPTEQHELALKVELADALDGYRFQYEDNQSPESQFIEFTFRRDPNDPSQIAIEFPAASTDINGLLEPITSNDVIRSELDGLLDRRSELTVRIDLRTDPADINRRGNTIPESIRLRFDAR